MSLFHANGEHNLAVATNMNNLEKDENNNMEKDESNDCNILSGRQIDNNSYCDEQGSRETKIVTRRSTDE